MMITNQQVCVHAVQKDGQESEVACLVATTRESDNVTAVTKVFTAERWRGRGCAARLLYRVCQEWVLSTVDVHFETLSDSLIVFSRRKSASSSM
jgi:predicted GNAT family acetyltransferase